MNVLVLGLGNILLSDEGVGVRIVEALEERYQLPETVEVLDGGTSGMDLLDQIAGHDLLIVADAIRADEAPGTVIRLADDEIKAFFRTRMSPHQIGLADVLASLRLSNEEPRHVVIIGVVPESLDLGLDLTPVNAAARETAVTMIVDELRTSGIDATLREQVS
ncbi:MAG: HyaD/HybD family hydrogenase maturation endopeptidase [Hyphomicrobiales bacterium]|nr:HyaD/HybD family hydrogenase maturation endopeptidase [Hyphomicrobiales bacterium]